MAERQTPKVGFRDGRTYTTAGVRTYTYLVPSLAAGSPSLGTRATLLPTLSRIWRALLLPVGVDAELAHIVAAASVVFAPRFESVSFAHAAAVARIAMIAATVLLCGFHRIR